MAAVLITISEILFLLIILVSVVFGVYLRIKLSKKQNNPESRVLTIKRHHSAGTVDETHHAVNYRTHSR